ncbi:MAG: hypothetical protein ACPG2Y_01365, partial [Acholeplasmataceae bacterium]
MLQDEGKKGLLELNFVKQWFSRVINETALGKNLKESTAHLSQNLAYIYMNTSSFLIDAIMNHCYCLQHCAVEADALFIEEEEESDDNKDENQDDNQVQEKNNNNNNNSNNKDKNKDKNKDSNSNSNNTDNEDNMSNEMDDIDMDGSKGNDMDDMDNIVDEIVSLDNVCEKFGSFVRDVMKDPGNVDKLRKFILSQKSEIEFHVQSFVHTREDFAVSEGIFQLSIGICLMMLQNGLASRVLDGTKNKRKQHKIREYTMPKQVKQWLVRYINNPLSWIHDVLFNSGSSLRNTDAIPGEKDFPPYLQDNKTNESSESSQEGIKNDEKNKHGFNKDLDYEISMWQFGRDCAVQNQCAQHVLGLYASLLTILPILPQCAEAAFIWDSTCIGVGFECIKRCLKMMIKMNYWKVADGVNQSQGHQSNNGNKKSKRRKQKNPKRKQKSEKRCIFRKSQANNMSKKPSPIEIKEANKVQCIEYSHKLAWSILLYNASLPNSTGDSIMMPVISPNQEVHPWPQPFSGALYMFSESVVNRHLKNIEIDFRHVDTACEKVKFNKILAANFHNHELKSNVEYLTLLKFFHTLLDEMTFMYGDWYYRVFDKKFVQQEFWKQDLVFKKRFSRKSEAKWAVAPMIQGGLWYPPGWKFRHEAQAQLGESFSFRNCVLLMRRYGISCPLEVNTKDLMNEDADAAGFTDGEKSDEEKAPKLKENDEVIFYGDSAPDVEDDDAKQLTAEVTAGLANLSVDTGDSESSSGGGIVGVSKSRRNKQDKKLKNKDVTVTSKLSMTRRKKMKNKYFNQDKYEQSTSHINLKMNPNVSDNGNNNDTQDFTFSS